MIRFVKFPLASVALCIDDYIYFDGIGLGIRTIANVNNVDHQVDRNDRERTAGVEV